MRCRGDKTRTKLVHPISHDCVSLITEEETQTNVRLTDINVVAEVKAIQMAPACPKEGPNFQGMQSLEYTND